MKLRKILAGLSCICMLSTMIPVIAQPIETKAQTIEFSEDSFNTEDLTLVKTKTYYGVTCDLYDNGLVVMTGTRSGGTFVSTSNGETWGSLGDMERENRINITKVYCDFTINKDSDSDSKDFGTYLLNLTHLEEVVFGDNFIGTSKYIKSLGLSFKDCTSLKSIDFSKCDLSDVTEMNNMCKGCDSLKLIKTPYKTGKNISFLSSALPENTTWYKVENFEATDKVVTGTIFKNLTESVTITTDPNYFDDSPRKYTEDGTSKMKVKAGVTDCYTVKIPAILNLTREGDTYTYSGEYEIGAKGIIPDDKYVSIYPQNFLTHEAVSFTGQNTGIVVTGTITQDKNGFINNPTDLFSSFIKIGYNDFATTKGKVSVEFNVADNYKANIGFTFGLNTSN